MRWIVLTLTLAACAAPDPGAEERAASARATLAYIQRPDVAARLDASAAEGRREMLARMTPEEREARAAEMRTQQAAIICRARGTLATTQPAYGGPGWAGALGAGLQLGWAGANAEEICLRTYQATGIMPTY